MAPTPLIPHRATIMVTGEDMSTASIWKEGENISQPWMLLYTFLQGSQWFAAHVSELFWPVLASAAGRAVAGRAAEEREGEARATAMAEAVKIDPD